MSKGAEERSRVLAIRCANLAEEGFTHRQIALMVEKRPEQIKALIELGERLKDARFLSPNNG